MSLTRVMLCNVPGRPSSILYLAQYLVLNKHYTLFDFSKIVHEWRSGNDVWLEIDTAHLPDVLGEIVNMGFSIQPQHLYDLVPHSLSSVSGSQQVRLPGIDEPGIYLHGDVRETDKGYTSFSITAKAMHPMYGGQVMPALKSLLPYIIASNKNYDVTLTVLLNRTGFPADTPAGAMYEAVRTWLAGILKIELE